MARFLFSWVFSMMNTGSIWDLPGVNPHWTNIDEAYPTIIDANGDIRFFVDWFGSAPISSFRTTSSSANCEGSRWFHCVLDKYGHIQNKCSSASLVPLVMPRWFCAVIILTIFLPFFLHGTHWNSSFIAASVRWSR